MNRKSTTYHYCARCRMTTAHDEAPRDSRCRRCGAVKSAAVIKTDEMQKP